MQETIERTSTGHRLRIDGDRQFEGQPGDSTMRVTGERDGTQVFDATYVEVSAQEAELVGWLIRSIRQPTPEVNGDIAQELVAAFPELSGRDGHQAAELCWKAIRQAARQTLGAPEGEANYRLEQVAERFERASSRAGVPIGQSSGGNGHEQSGKGR